MEVGKEKNTKEQERGDPQPLSRRRARYVLDELLAQCHPKACRSKEDRKWLNSEPAGGELV
jgi:hypothetical protein